MLKLKILKKDTIWQRLKKQSQKSGQPFFVLAPMEAVTDTVFRRVIIRAGRPDLFFTEFTNAEGWNSTAGNHVVGRRLKYKSEEKPLIAQIWSSSPKAITKMSKDLKKLGFDGIDLNMGCPVKSATKHSSGSALILNPELAGQMIQAAKKGGLPVSVKTRLGYSKVNEWKVWLKFLLEQDIVALTVHARTKKEMSKVPAHLDLFPQIVKLKNQVAPKTLIIANGDIMNKSQGIELAKKSKVDGIMIGRGVFQNIFCFNSEFNPESSGESKAELLRMLNYHLDLFEEELKVHPEKKFDPLKRFFKIYIRGFDGASDLRVQLMESKNLKEVRKILKANT
ncbi:tRNA-dihydrouridine synthase [Candidatus Saccharibacteria bacterium]|jgi:tRNA-dihydrouridine synthase|nr:tRNA-dihydrouridine synthase [Candidatus Saccharibacteria bacterium]